MTAAETGTEANVEIALLGADALLATRPATPVQLIHACLAVGYDAAYPVSWGDELVARACLRVLRRCEGGPIALCACPYAAAAARGHAHGASLVVAAPPVAAARLVRAAYPNRAVRITYIGACPSGAHPDIDVQYAPAAFLAAIVHQGVVIAEQPEEFDAVLPPDRRRFLSLPGGAPTHEQLHSIGWSMVHEPGLAAQRMRVLVDEAPHLGCVCAGTPDGRDAIVRLEPPRAANAVLDPDVEIDLSLGPAPAIVPDEAEAEPPAAEFEPVIVHSAFPEPVVIKHGSPDEAELPPILGFDDRPLHGEPVRELAWRGSGWRRARDGRRRGRRPSKAILIMAAALALTVPFAGYGGWVLLRDNVFLPESMDAARAPVSSTADGSIPSTQSPLTVPIQPDSALGSGAGALERVRPRSDSAMTAPDTTTTTKPARTAAPEPHAPVSAPRRVTPRQAPPATAPRATPPVGLPRVATPDSQRSVPRDSAFLEREALREEIARRRARVDSLTRLSDSLRKAKPSSTR